jgi:multiple sugar transport system permease protein
VSGTTEATGATRAAPVAGQTPWRQALVAWSFGLPFLILFAVFMVLPIIAAAVTSFTDLTSRDIRNPLSVEFIGVENYVNVLTDPKFHKAAGNTVVYVLVGVPLTMVLGLLTAVGLNQGVVKFRTVFRVGYYLPVVTSIVAVAVVWRLLLGTDTGLINGLLSTIGVDGPGWLTDQSFALWSVMAMAIWRGLGFLMIIFLAGLQTIPSDLYEAAEVDGAGRLQRFWGITVPMMRPTLLFGAVITVIGWVQFFEEVFVMTQGGPLDATLSVAFQAYSQFSFGNYAYTAAMAFILFIAIGTLTFVQFRVFRPAT